jgi:hypothetical protein
VPVTVPDPTTVAVRSVAIGMPAAA